MTVGDRVGQRQYPVESGRVSPDTITTVDGLQLQVVYKCGLLLCA